MPKLKDKIYGEMNWEQWEEDFGFWFSRMDDEEYGQFQFFIRADTPLDFLAVRNTHKTFDALMVNLPVLRDQAVQNLFKNSKIFPNKKERIHVARIFGENLELDGMTIFEDLSAEIRFDAVIITEMNSTVVILVDSAGKFIRAFFEND